MLEVTTGEDGYIHARFSFNSSSKNSKHMNFITVYGIDETAALKKLIDQIQVFIEESHG
jgi:hypothetical protein